MEPQIGRKNVLKRLDPRKLFVGAVIAAVVAAVGVGLYLAGGPISARQKQFDERRSNHLQSISSAVETFYRKFGRLPGTLDDLRSSDYYLESVTDPASGEPYNYQVTGDRGYELCAFFARTSSRSTPYAPKPIYATTPDFWLHPSGYHCFSVDIRLAAVGPACGIGLSACPQDLNCVILPDTREAVCVPTGGECLAAGCPGKCSLLESYPMQVVCDKVLPTP